MLGLAANAYRSKDYPNVCVFVEKTYAKREVKKKWSSSPPLYHLISKQNKQKKFLRTKKTVKKWFRPQKKQKKKKTANLRYLIVYQDLVQPVVRTTLNFFVKRRYRRETVGDFLKCRGRHTINFIDCYNNWKRLFMICLEHKIKSLWLPTLTPTLTNLKTQKEVTKI